jgi:hypothetical protein
MRVLGLKAIQARKFKVTTDSNHTKPVASDLIFKWLSRDDREVDIGNSHSIQDSWARTGYLELIRGLTEQYAEQGSFGSNACASVQGERALRLRYCQQNFPPMVRLRPPAIGRPRFVVRPRDGDKGAG